MSVTNPNARRPWTNGTEVRFTDSMRAAIRKGDKIDLQGDQNSIILPAWIADVYGVAKGYDKPQYMVEFASETDQLYSCWIPASCLTQSRFTIRQEPIKEITVTVYEASDGKRFDTKEAAYKHQLTIEIIAFVDKHGYTSMSHSDIRNMLIEHIDELKTIINKDKTP